MIFFARFFLKKCFAHFYKINNKFNIELLFNITLNQLKIKIYFEDKNIF
jgi:hypothetical protein